MSAVAPRRLLPIRRRRSRGLPGRCALDTPFRGHGPQANVDAWQIRCGAPRWIGVGRVPYRVVDALINRIDAYQARANLLL